MITVAPALLFGIGTVVLARERRMPVLSLLIVWFFGFFVAATPLGHALADSLTHWLAGSGGDHPVAPSPVPGTAVRQA